MTGYSALGGNKTLELDINYMARQPCKEDSMPTAGNEAPAGYRHAMRWAQIASAGALWAALATPCRANSRAVPRAGPPGLRAARRRHADQAPSAIYAPSEGEGQARARLVPVAYG